MKHLKYFKIFENSELTDEDILSQLNDWDIDYYWSETEKYLWLEFKYPDRVNHLEIDTINKVVAKLPDIKSIQISSGDINEMFFKEDVLNNLKVPNGCIVITGFYNIIKKYCPEIKEYLDNLFSNLKKIKENNLICYYKDNEKILEHDIINDEMWCHADKIFNYFTEYGLEMDEIYNIVKGILKDYLNITVSYIQDTLNENKIFENSELSDLSEDDIISQLKDWDINPSWNKYDKILRLKFVYSDRVTIHEIQTINKVINKIKPNCISLSNQGKLQGDILNKLLLNDNLKKLDLSFNEDINDLPLLPDSLEILDIKYTNIRKLKNIPKNLKVIEYTTGFKLNDERFERLNIEGNLSYEIVEYYKDIIYIHEVTTTDDKIPTWSKYHWQHKKYTYNNPLAIISQNYISLYDKNGKRLCLPKTKNSSILEGKKINKLEFNNELKKLKTTTNRVLENLNSENLEKPEIFTHTIYRMPTISEIKDFKNFPNLTAKDIFNGFCYTIIGRGLRDSKNIKMIKDSIKMLINNFPNENKYKEALILSEELKPRFVPLIAYHGTSSKHLSSIIKNGLNKPYLTSTKALAEYYASVESEEDGGEPIIFEVLIDDKSKLKIDDAAMSEPVVIIGDEEEKRDEYWKKAAKEHPEWLDDDIIMIPDNEWTYSWFSVGSVWYDGIINKDKFKEV